MGSASRLTTGARSIGAGASAALLVRAARSLHRRWETLGPAERERLREVAERARQRALDLRGRVDRDAAEQELASANVELATALGDAAAADPEVTTVELQALRAELAAELDRVARRSQG
jgi:hypothetical protein